MAFPASLSILQTEFSQALYTASALKQNAQGLRNASAAGPVTRGAVLELWRQLGAALVIWNRAATTPGMAQYAMDQFDNQSLDIAAEFTAMLAAADSLRGWINTNFPRNGSGALLLETADANGVRSNMTFTTLELADFRTQADSFIATIN